MSKKSSITSSGPGFFGELWQQAKLVFQLLFDSDVPLYLKLVPFAAIAYLIFPFDFLPDVVPGLGQLDDLTILLIGAKIFIDLAPQDIVAQYLGTLKEAGSKDDIAEQGANDRGDDDVIEGIIIDDDGE